MSIFSVPNNVDRYVDRVSNGHTITGQDIITAENAVAYREEFAQSALNVGFREDGVLRPELMHWHIVQIVDKTLREKQADTKLAALLVKYAITEPNDYLAVISGDQDILPAIEIASEFSHNVLLATNHHDENNSQSSSLLSKYDFRIKPVYLQHIVKHIMIGDNVYRCSACEHFFNADRPVDERKEQPRCPQCKTNRRNS